MRRAVSHCRSQQNHHGSTLTLIWSKIQHTVSVIACLRSCCCISPASYVNNSIRDKLVTPILRTAVKRLP